MPAAMRNAHNVCLLHNQQVNIGQRSSVRLVCEPGCERQRGPGDNASLLSRQLITGASASASSGYIVVRSFGRPTQLRPKLAVFIPSAVLCMTVRPRPIPPAHPNSWSAWDRAVSIKLFHASSRTIPRKYMMLLEHSGNGLVWLFAALTIWFMPSITPQQRCAITNFLLAFVVDLILVGSLKSLIRRPRPIYNSSGDFILGVSVDQYSFPSGHASRCSLISEC